MVRFLKKNHFIGCLLFLPPFSTPPPQDFSYIQWSNQLTKLLANTVKDKTQPSKETQELL